jgi:hypothetical protein
MYFNPLGIGPLHYIFILLLSFFIGSLFVIVPFVSYIDQGDLVLEIIKGYL